MLLARAVINILENALHAMPGGGTLTVTARRDGQRLVLAIADTGVGMDAEALGPHLRAVLLDQGQRHRPRLEHRPPQRRAARRHDRRASTRGVGTTVTIELPFRPPAA